MSSRLTILVYCQSLSGTGHFVRSYEIARVLATRHDVFLVDGGRPVKRCGTGVGVRLVEIPRICRANGVIQPLEPGADLSAVLAGREAILLDMAAALRPDVLLVEQFPFSRWELGGEIIALIEKTRAVSAGVRVFCSRRDIVPPSRYDGDPIEHAALALGMLHGMFDGVLVHGDPKLTRIDDHTPWAGQIRLPVAYTGYVSEKLDGNGVTRRPLDAHSGAYVVVSGGGAGDGTLEPACIHAWQTITKTNGWSNRTLLVTEPPFVDPQRRAELHAAGTTDRVCFRGFASDFLTVMANAGLSITHAGYNTCTNILESRAKAIVVPYAQMPDQLCRAQVLADHGLVTMIRPDDVSGPAIAQAMQETLGKPHPRHDIDLDGSENTLRFLEQ